MKKSVLIILIFFLGQDMIFAQETMSSLEGSQYQKDVKEIFVSSNGSDSNSGSIKTPFATFERALVELEKFANKKPVNIWFDAGSYHLQNTIKLGTEFSGSEENPILFSALPGKKVVIKGSQKLKNLQWKAYKDDIYVTSVPSDLNFDQLFINGERQIRARFPNYDFENPIRGGKGYLEVTGGTNNRYDEWFTYDPENFSKKEWKNTETGIVHAFQSHNWGNMQYRLSGVKKEENRIILGEGGWQLQRSFGIGGSEKKASAYYIENIFEELDVAGEWFLDKEKNLLYYFPKSKKILNTAIIEVPVMKDLIQLKGDSKKPVRNITFKGFHFTQSNFTFMDTYEPLARGDWAIHRGGAIYMEGAENCTIENCNFEYLGGNGVFMSGYNRKNTVKNSRFVHTGESAVAMVGLPSAVRFYQTWDDSQILGKNWGEMRKNMDLEPGPKTLDYPKDCIVENSIMHDFGDYGKQVAGIFISMSHKITASHNTIYNCPRAGICINDGTWGGHIIEYNDIWETVRETGEHGPFNSWGRERQWLGGSGSDEDFIKEYVKLDVLDATIIRNNRIANYRKSISAGNWTIDLDDGSSFYEIYNNLNLGSTIKLRDGMFRKVYNNITVSAVPLGWHVWPKASEDEIYKNIFVISGAVPGKNEPTNQFVRPIGLRKDSKWSNNYDYNLYWNVNFTDTPYILDNKSMEAWQADGYDINSEIANPLFINPVEGNYNVKADSPALKLGFKNFPMNKFGHQMTRIVPYGGDFSNEITVSLIADARIKSDGTLRYTLDGTEPTDTSPLYSKPLKLQNTTLVKTRSFDEDGNTIGFVNDVQFNKVDKVEYPSWLSTLLVGKYDNVVARSETTKALELVIKGALMVNIGDDPDLIDASGGYNTGCLIKSIDPVKGKIWLDSGLQNGWIIQKINSNIIEDISDLQNLLKKYARKRVNITAVKNYESKLFKISLK